MRTIGIADWLAPNEFEPGSYRMLPDNNLRLSIHRLVQWELRNASSAFEKLSDELLVPLKALINSAAARDKLARLLQYALLVPIGLLAEMNPNNARRQISAHCARLREALSDARRTFRWFQGVTPLLALRPSALIHSESRADLWCLSVSSQLGMLAYTMLDHCRWLQQLKLISGDKARSAARAERCLAAMHICNLAALVRRVSGRPQEWERLHERARRVLGQLILQWLLPALRRWLPDMTAQLLPADRHAALETALSADSPPLPPLSGSERETMRTAARELMCFLQCAHIGKILQTHDAFVGFLGAITSSMDLYRTLRPASKSA